MKRWRRLAILAALVLGGCGGTKVYDLCPGTPCTERGDEGTCIDLLPGHARCVAGAWAIDYEPGLCSPHQCTASMPAPVHTGDVDSGCHFEQVQCVGGTP